MPKAQKAVDEAPKPVKAKKPSYPSEFILCRTEIQTRLKPNGRDTFIISKFSGEGKAIFSRSHNYMALTPISTQDSYVLRAYIIPDEFKPTFASSMYTEYGIFAFQSQSQPDEIIPVYAASWEFTKCPACGGSGTFKQVNKVTLGQQQNLPQKSKLAQAQAGSEIVANQCVYNHVRQIGCDGTGIDKAQVELYQQKVAGLFKFDGPKMDAFLEFAQYSGRGPEADA